MCEVYIWEEVETGEYLLESAAVEGAALSSLRQFSDGVAKASSHTHTQKKKGKKKKNNAFWIGNWRGEKNISLCKWGPS